MEIDELVIFTTAFDHYAVDAFRHNALDYLLKPIKMEELKMALKKARKMNELVLKEPSEMPNKLKNRFLIKVGRKLHIVRADEIAFIYTESKLIHIVKEDNKKIVADTNLQQFSESLDPEQYFRINRQFIVHIESINELIAYSKSRINVMLDPVYNGEIIISTETSSMFKKWLNK